MRLLASTDFALRALMRLASDPDRLLSTEYLARDLAVSRHHLHKVVQSLSDAGFVRTTRGAKGGVTLARPPAKIKIGAVVRAFERDQAIVECFRADGGQCSLTPACRLRRILADAREGFFGHLDGFTLADSLLASPKPVRRSATSEKTAARNPAPPAPGPGTRRGPARRASRASRA